MSMSPLGLVQERVSRSRHFPWRVLVCCALLNRTTKEQARPALSAFFAWWPTPEYFALTGPTYAALRNLLAPLGLVNRRRELLIRMTDDYLAGASPYECFGVGEYARDALDLFCAGEVFAGAADHYLAGYARWRMFGGRRVEWDEEGYLEWVVSLDTSRAPLPGHNGGGAGR